MKQYIDLAERSFEPIYENADIDDNEAKRQVIDLLNRMTYGTDGYFFAYTWEEDVLAALANGDCNKNIARHLNISVRTVETHRLRIKRKLGVKSTAALVRIALERGLVC
ncbi:MAG: cache domain-containing protein [Aliivibrio sp.]|nr:cache domain-containing protein [Aliivibrio sp.]